MLHKDDAVVSGVTLRIRKEDDGHYIGLTAARSGGLVVLSEVSLILRHGLFIRNGSGWGNGDAQQPERLGARSPALPRVPCGGDGEGTPGIRYNSQANVTIYATDDRVTFASALASEVSYGSWPCEKVAVGDPVILVMGIWGFSARTAPNSI